MQVKDIMSKDIVSLNSQDSVERAAQIMKQFDVGSIPICNSKNLVGIITDRDITLNCVASSANANEQKICDYMSSTPVTGTPEMDVHDAAKIMSQEQVRRLPIVENGKLVGMVSLGDISLEPTLQDNAEKALKNISEPGTNNNI